MPISNRKQHVELALRIFFEAVGKERSKETVADTEDVIRGIKFSRFIGFSAKMHNARGPRRPTYIRYLPIASC